MDLIIPHINADFDAVASAVAASKLYPEAKLFFPGSQERNVRQFLAAYNDLLPKIIKAKELVKKDIKCMILVDVSQPERLGEFKTLLELKHIELIRFDHHLSKSDLPNEFFQKQAGANTSLMVELLRKKSIHVDWKTATLFGLGIYEETGQFSYSTTTALDFEALAWCKQHGADLSVIIQFLKQPFNHDQQALFDDLIKSRETKIINGFPISIALAKRDHYIEDLAVLTSKLKEMENLPALFVFCQMGTRIYLVARSNSPEIPADQIVALFGGGGGHQTAASTVIKNKSLSQLKEILLSALAQMIHASIQAKTIMSQPVICVQTSDSVQEVRRVMTRFEHTGLPVVEQGKLKGMITLHDLDKTLHHGFKSSNIMDYMTTQVYTVTPTALIDHIQQLLIDHHINHLPVIKQNQPIGMITRSDVFNALVEKRTMLQSQAVHRFFQINQDNLKELIIDRLPKPLLNLIHTAGIVADQLGVQAFLVGGFVRDLLLKIDNWDVDIVIEGDGIKFAEKYAKKIGGHIKVHERFRTAVIKLPNKQKIDIATARTEYYEKPAALPQVEQATIKYDLYRRDFSINTLAVTINHNKFGQLIDYFGGLHDLKEGKLRVLYAISFVEDPTRLFRAIRFEQRLDFSIEPDTLRYMEHAISLDLVRKLSMPRIFDELLLILDEDQPEKAIKRLGELGMLPWIHKKLTSTNFILENFYQAWEALAFAIIYLDEKIEKRIIYLMALFDELTKDELALLANLCQFPKRLKELLRMQKQAGDQARKRIENMEAYPAARVVKALNSLPIEVVLYEMVRCHKKHSNKLFRKYLIEWRFVKPILTGRDLKKMGYPPGPLFEKMLIKLRNGYLNNKLHSRRDEVNCLHRFYPKSDVKTNDKK